MSSVFRYVLGFIFDPELEFVLLLNKLTGPQTALGWNGLGGAVKDQETEAMAMAREAEEESGFWIPPQQWVYSGGLFNSESSYFIGVYGAVHDSLPNNKSEVDQVFLLRMDRIPSTCHRQFAKCAESALFQSREVLRQSRNQRYKPFMMDMGVG